MRLKLSKCPYLTLVHSVPLPVQPLLLLIHAGLVHGLAPGLLAPFPLARPGVFLVARGRQRSLFLVFPAMVFNYEI